MASNLETVARERIVSQFRELGLSSHEALAYATLLKHSSMTASALCKETGIPDSKIYYALDGLSRRGMLIVQKGNPNLYLPVPPKEAAVNLKTRLAAELEEKNREADVLADLLTPMYESVEKAQELEIAYIIRGQKNIINRMKTLVESARKEVAFFVSYPAVFREVVDSLTKANEKHRVKLNVAVARRVAEEVDFSGLGEIGVLCCKPDFAELDSMGMLIVDAKTLLTLANWAEETAVLTQDPSLVRVCRSYFDNPSLRNACKIIR